MKPTFLRNLELEAAIAEDPYDDGSWSVLEDWLIERGDPRGAIVCAERARAGETAYAGLWAALLGPMYGPALRSLLRSQRRAGFLLDATIELPLSRIPLTASTPYATIHSHVLEHGEGMRLLRELTITGDVTAVLRLAHLLPSFPCGRTLRALTLDCSDMFRGSRPELSTTTLATMSLTRLAVRAFTAGFEYTSAMQHLTHLEVWPTSYDDMTLMFHAGAFPQLRELTIDTTNLTAPKGDELAIEPFETLFDGRAAPKLEVLAMHCPGKYRALFDALEYSRIIKQLREVHLGTDHEVEPASLGDVFAHLARVRVPAHFSIGWVK